MEEWKTYKIKDISKVNLSQYSLKEGWEEIAYLDTGSITENRIDSIQTFILPCDVFPSRARRKVRHNDILFSTVRPNQRHYGILKNPPENLLVSTGFAVITVDPALADADFVYFYLTQTELIDFLQGVAEQSVSAYPSLKSSDIEDLEIVLPSLAEQKRIASILSSLDNKIALNVRINHNLEEQAQALYKSWFIDFEPFKGGQFVDSELGLIPEGWHIGTLSEIADITMGQSPSGASFNEEGRGIIFYQGRTEFGFRFPSIKLFTTEPTRFSEPKSILMSVRAPVGDINISKVRCCIGRGLASINPHTSSYSFVLYTMKSKVEELDLYNGEGTVFGSINRKELEGLTVLIPPKDVINSFNTLVTPVDMKVEVLSDEITNLQKQRNTLLPQLMSGQFTC